MPAKKAKKHELTLTYDLDEHKADAILALRGAELWHAVYGFQEWLRNREKYESFHKTGSEEIEEIRKWFNEGPGEVMYKIESDGVN